MRRGVGPAKRAHAGGAVPMRQECKQFESRTYSNGDTVGECDLDLAPDAPWHCPDNCPMYERRLAGLAWTHGSLVTQPTPAEPASVADGTGQYPSACFTKIVLTRLGVMARLMTRTLFTPLPTP